MSPEALRPCSGYSVSIKVNDKPALGVLRFDREVRPCITTLCFLTQEDGECPVLSRPLSALEIESLSVLGNCHLESSITLTANEGEVKLTAMDRLIMNGGDTAAGQQGKAPKASPPDEQPPA